MSEKYKFRDPDGMYFATSTIVGWVDVFTRPELKHIVVNSLRRCQKEKGLAIHAWCLMPSHLHMIISGYKDPLSGIMRDFKSYTANEIVKELDTIYESRRHWMLHLFGEDGEGSKRNTNYKVWQDGNPSNLIDEKEVCNGEDEVHP